MDIDKSLIGKSPNVAVVINEQIIEKEKSYKQEDKQEPLIINGDTREKLEDDALELASKIWNSGCNYSKGDRNPKSCAWNKNDVIALLDRQAAITERKWLDGKTHIFGMTFDEVRGLQAKVNNLTVERDELSNAVDKLQRQADGMFCLNDLSDKRIKELEAKVESLKQQVRALRDLNDIYEWRVLKLTDERERLRDVAKQQAENFKKLEIELSKKTCTAEDLRTTAYECEQLRKKLDKIKEIVDAV